MQIVGGGNLIYCSELDGLKVLCGISPPLPSPPNTYVQVARQNSNLFAFEGSGKASGRTISHRAGEKTTYNGERRLYVPAFCYCVGDLGR